MTLFYYNCDFDLFYNSWFGNNEVKIKQKKLNKCKKCKDVINDESLTYCYSCKNNLFKIYLIKNSFNNITKNIPNEIIDEICNYI